MSFHFMANACRFCGCTDDNPCIDLRTGETCGWAMEDVCTFCAWEPLVRLLLTAEFAHQAAQQLPAYRPEQHAEAKRLYEALR